MSVRSAQLGQSTQEANEMSCFAIQARCHLGAIVQFIAPSMPLKSALPRAAAYVGLNARRCRALWNKEARAIHAHEIHQLEAARARISERLLTKDLTDHASHLEIRAARLATDDSYFHREEISRLRRMAQLTRDFAADLGA
jgi:hypothetical protein